MLRQLVEQHHVEQRLVHLDAAVMSCLDSVPYHSSQTHLLTLKLGVNFGGRGGPLKRVWQSSDSATMRDRCLLIGNDEMLVNKLALHELASPSRQALWSSLRLMSTAKAARSVKVT